MKPYLPYRPYRPYLTGAGAAAWSPTELTGLTVWYDPSDLSTLFQDSVGTTPVTADGQPVGMSLNKAYGLTLGSERCTNGGPFTATTGWSGTNLSVAGGILSASAPSAGDHMYGPWLGALGSLAARRYFQITWTITAITGRVRVQLYGSNAVSSWYSTPGTYTVRLFQTDSNGNVGLSTDGALALSISAFSVKEIIGYHATQSTAAARPLYKTDGTYHWLLDDNVDDSIAATVPDMGTDATVAYAENGATVILTGQTIGAGTLTLPNTARNYGYIAVNRALTVGETTSVTAYLDALRGA